MKRIHVKKISIGNQEVHFPAPKFSNLKKHIKKHGLLTPIVVTPESNGKHTVIQGVIRFLAFRSLGKKMIPAEIRHFENAQDYMEFALTREMCIR